MRHTVLIACLSCREIAPIEEFIANGATNHGFGTPPPTPDRCSSPLPELDLSSVLASLQAEIPTECIESIADAEVVVDAIGARALHTERAHATRPVRAMPRQSGAMTDRGAHHRRALVRPLDVRRREVIKFGSTAEHSPEPPANCSASDVSSSDSSDTLNSGRQAGQMVSPRGHSRVYLRDMKMTRGVNRSKRSRMHRSADAELQRVGRRTDAAFHTVNTPRQAPP